jgi:RNA polymerase sigma factor (sigma-70 family)
MKKKVTTHHQFQQEEHVLYQAIKDFQNGNKEKATVIYENSKQYSYNIIYHQITKFISQNIISGDAKTIVEDIMQEVYMEFFDNIEKFRNEEPKSFYKWISVVANRKVLRYVDRNKMEVLQKEQKREFDEYDISFTMEIADEEENYSEFIPDMVLEEKEFQKLMKKFVKKLPEEQAQTILYHVYGGLKYQ